MEQHLEKCSRCVEQLGSIKGDTLGDRLLTVGTLFDRVQETDRAEVPPALRDHPRYEIIERIGGGGMGDVYQAKQRSMDRLVAIKVLRQSLFENDRAVARFHNEVKIAASLNHPNIVHSYDADLSNGLHILIMELVNGAKLSDVVAHEGPLSPFDACQIAVEIAKGLEYANEEGMIHRDIKPQNIMVLPDRSIKITDFGLAKLTLGNLDRDEGSLTYEGEVFGTPDYIAPEQIRDASGTDRRSDIYSLGCTLYFMLTGRPPFAEQSVGEKLASHLEKEPLSLAELRPNIPFELIQAIERMMQKSAERRPQTYLEVVESLDPFCNSEFVDADPMAIVPQAVAVETAIDLPPPSPSQRQATFSRRTLLGGGGIVFAIVGICLWAMGVFPSPFGGSTTNPRSGKIKIAIVVPSVNAYFPEIQGLFRAAKRRSDVEIEFLAEEIGPVGFFHHKAGPPRKIRIDQTLVNVSASDFDAVIFTGGWNGDGPKDTKYAFDERLNQQARQFCRELLKQGKPVAGICGGTAVLSKAGLLRDRQVANCRYLSPELREESGAIWTEIPAQDKLATTVIDGQFVTGGNAVNCEEVFEAVVNVALNSRN